MNSFCEQGKCRCTEPILKLRDFLLNFFVMLVDAGYTIFGEMTFGDPTFGEMTFGERLLLFQTFGDLDFW